MPTTPKGFPYPTPDDPVSLGANDIKALAEAADARSLWEVSGPGMSTNLAYVVLGPGVAGLYVDSGGPIYFGAARDATLYRAGPAALKTDGTFEAANAVFAGNGFYGSAYAQKALWAPSAAAAFKLIGGGAIVTLDGAGHGVVPFGITAAAVLTVTVNGTQTGVPLICPIIASTLTGFTVEAWLPGAADPALIVNTSIAINWLAIVQI